MPEGNTDLIRRVGVLEREAAEHGGRVNAYWEAQHELNNRVDERMVSLGNRLTAAEKRIAWFAGAAAAIGSIVGALLGEMG